MRTILAWYHFATKWDGLLLHRILPLSTIKNMDKPTFITLQYRQYGQKLHKTCQEEVWYKFGCIADYV